ncbi:MAG: DNA repair protein RecN [Bacteroidales bacterium]|nr:DNA repair protein RecN [Bacteroidales bacterium]
MLSSLYIQDYALISSLQIQLDNGMTVITGETGAGKSIIMGALSLILGNRADSSALFDKSKKCVVEASFVLEDLDVKRFFEVYDLDYQDTTIVRREILPNGKSRAFINDTPVNLPTLKEFASLMIDIHSQHQNLLFQNADFRTDVVDLFAGIKNKVSDYQLLLEELKQTQKQFDTLTAENQARLEKQDFLQFVFQELEQANLRENEQEELEQSIDFLSHTETIKANLFQILHLISDADESALNSLRESKSLSAQIAPYRSDIEELNNRIESNFIDLKDIADEISALNDRIDYNPEELEAMRQRLDLIYALEQKHHVSSLPQLIEKKNTINQELALFSSDEQQLNILQQKLDEIKKNLVLQAKQLHQAREKVLLPLQKQILEKVIALGMPDAQFVIKLEETTTLQKFGIDNVQFLFSANKGVPLAELEKVASGGEISRLMLAVKSTLSERSVLPTVVFDEIDVGISGEMAGKVATLMSQMSQKHQLLVITHLPQIAAKGTSHYQVFKEVENGKSHSRIRKLSKEDRIIEIAKMMSGEKCSDTTLKAAQELID